jgi:hypothetical protein
MRKHIYIFLTGLFLAGIPSCIFTDSETYYVDPIPGDLPQILVSTNLDTLYNPPVKDSLQVSYLVNISGGDFYYVYADIVNKTIFESDSMEGTFWITGSMAESAGVDTLYMEFYYASNSNSLGDKTGFEALSEILTFAVDFQPGNGR